MSATNRGAIRRLQDKYQTPLSAIEPLLGHIDWSRVKSFGEPCLGKGNIMNLVHQNLIRHCKDHAPARLFYCEIVHGLDYFKNDWPNLDLIITNPPFALLLPFLQRSLGQAATVIYLMRINVLGSGGGQRARPETRARSQFFKANPPTHLLALSERPSFRLSGGTDSCEYAWFAWDRGSFLTVPPGVYVL